MLINSHSIAVKESVP